MIEKQPISFAGKKLNWDDHIDIIPLGDSRYRYDIVYPNGDNNVLESRRGFSPHSMTLSPGTNTPIGVCEDKENDAVIIFFHNSNNYHSIVRYYSTDNYQYLSLGKSTWNFQSGYGVKAIIIGTGDNAFLIFTDNYNPIRCVNIKNLIDGDYASLEDGDINLLKPAPLINITLNKEYISSIKINKIRGKRFQFTLSYTFKDGLESTIGHWSKSVFNYQDDFFSGLYSEYQPANALKLVFTPLSYVDTVTIYMKVTDLGSGASGSWVKYDTIDNTGIITYYFYNDKQGTYEDQSKFTHLYDNIPLKARSITSINGDRILLGELNSKYSNVETDIELTHVPVVNSISSEIITRTSGSATPISVPPDTFYYVDTDILGVANKRVEYCIIITQTTGGTVITGQERYYYQYSTFGTSGGYMDNANIVAYFMDEINSKTAFPITINSVTTGGHPRLIRMLYLDSGPQYFLTVLSSPVLDKVECFKDNSILYLGIRYCDKNNIPFPVSKIDPIKVLSNGGVLSNTTGYYNNYIKYQIDNLPPTGAAYFQFMYAGNNKTSHFTIPIFFAAYLGITSDVVYEGTNMKIDYNKALDRCYELNESANFNDFIPQKGDRICIKAYGFSNIVQLADYIDTEILDIDEDGKIIVSNTYTYGNFSSEYVYWVEIYRPRNIANEDDLIYYEIGDLMPITGGYHVPTTVVGSGITAQTQTSSVPAIGVINFGDIYRQYFNFYDAILPVITNVESQSSSFIYPSMFLSPNLDAASGRYGITNTKQINETEEALIYGGLFREGTFNYNDINRFKNDPVYVDSRFGEIVNVIQVGNTLRIYQEDKLSVCYLNATETTLADGSTQMNYNNTVLGTIKPLPYDVGCSHEFGIASNVYATYHFDIKTAAWYRFSQDGLTNITEGDFKMKAYGIYLSKLIKEDIQGADVIKIIGAFDPVKNMYIFTYKNVTDNTFITLGFHEPTNAWLSWYSFSGDVYFSFNGNKFYQLEKSTSNPIYANEHHLNTVYMSTGIVQLHLNVNPLQKKTFHTIEIGSEQTWAPSNSGDIIVDENSVAYQYESNEWINGKQTSYLKDTHFENYENRWVANFFRNIMNKKGVVSAKKTDLLNGEVLRGNTLSVKLRNLKNTINTLKYVIIGYQISK